MCVQLRQEETKYVLHVGSESSQHVFTSLPGYISTIKICSTVPFGNSANIIWNFLTTKNGCTINISELVICQEKSRHSQTYQFH